VELDVESHEQADWQDEPEPKPASGSLAGRMEGRATELAKQTNAWFPIPGYEDMLEVAFTPLGYQTMHRIQTRNARKIRDESLATLYNLADQLVVATDGFREVQGEKKIPLDGETWVSLAERLPGCPERPTARQAVLFLIGDSALPFLVQEYGDWARQRRQDNEEEVVRDFVTTG
jgi:hypothetical protein